jgi:hypothetical protein
MGRKTLVGGFTGHISCFTVGLKQESREPSIFREIRYSIRGAVRNSVSFEEVKFFPSDEQL